MLSFLVNNSLSIPWEGSPWYALIFMVALVFGLRSFCHLNASEPRLLFIYASGITGALLGAKLAFLFAEGALYWDSPHRWMIYLSGKSVMGALPGGWMGVEFAKYILNYKKITGDHFVKILIPALILGRLGCLHAGCCKGICFSFGEWPSVPVEMGFQAWMLLAFWYFRRHKIQVNQHFYLYLMAYGVFRFFHELLRNTPKVILYLSGYQWIALITVLVAFLAYKKRNQSCLLLN